MRNTILKIMTLFSLTFVIPACNNESSTYHKKYVAQKAFPAIAWADMSLFVLRHSYFNTPTYASRSLGYLGLAMYECVAPSDKRYRSLAGQLNGLDALPEVDTTIEYNYLLALNFAQDTLLKLFYPKDLNLSEPDFSRIDSLYDIVYKEHSKGVNEAIVERSIRFGRGIAVAIYNWSLSDGGHQGYNRNFDSTISFPKGKSYWIPPTKGQVVSRFPLHPLWGRNRTFLRKNSQLPVPKPLSYSCDTASEYFKVYNAVCLRNRVLTSEEKEIAAWWSDDPTETYSPPGHSYNLATISILKSNSSIVQAASLYAKVGIAVADAFINCWKVKYIYFNERPSTYIREHIDTSWTSYWPEPPFPAFPSGHATQGAACATVLTAVFGDSFSFVDNTHQGVHRFSPDLKFEPRKYNNFWETAIESAYSRFLGGIHTQQDNEVGLSVGKVVGNNINELHWSQ